MKNKEKLINYKIGKREVKTKKKVDIKKTAKQN